ncbi:MAG: protein-L-isoaspartate(D-aspartate) O-methyltransferase [Candidatus Cloacimonadota bacterium]|nr:protein-L-isoaspartate(D-aspartate) O-methyltransferase [Candidatus Cloacimonadota bacterium]
MKFEDQRKLMVQHQLKGRGIYDQRVLQAFFKVPREKFVPEEVKHLAYQDSPLGIGDGQTISQPYIVATMMQDLKLEPHDIVLEIGTGSGYQTALLAEIASEVFTVDRVWTLTQRAREVLAELGYDNIHFRCGDGSKGWEDKKLKCYFDKIIVAAAAPDVPASLTKQLAENGRMIIPVGNRFMQQLTIIIKKDGEIEKFGKEGCTFVPLIGQEGW